LFDYQAEQRVLKFLTSISITALLLPCFAVAQISGVEYSWELKRERSGIKIYTSKVPKSPFKAVRGEMIINAQVEELVALVNDLPRCSEWADLCVKSELLERVSSAEQYVYIYNNVPFPIKDRDVVAHVHWSKDEPTGRVSMHSIAVEQARSTEFRQLSKKAVRIYQAVTQWHFTPLGEGLVKVENYAHIDPNGPTPAWLINILLVNSPYKTMKNMRELIGSGDYQGAQSSF
jgi:hypothetical protein